MGLDIDYFYNLTPRQFANIQKGWALIRDADSKERIVLTRKLMYAALAPWSKNLTEDKLWKLDFLNIPEMEDTNPTTLKAIEAVAERWAYRDRLFKKEKSPLKLMDLLLLKQKSTL